MVLETATCRLERTSSTIIFGRDHLSRRARRLSECKGLPRLPSTPRYTTCPRISLFGVSHPRPCVFVLLRQATSVPPSSSNFGAWIYLPVFINNSFSIRRNGLVQGLRKSASNLLASWSNLTTLVHFPRIQFLATAP